MTARTRVGLKDDAKRVIDGLPDDVTVMELWHALDDFILRRKIEDALSYSASGGGMIPDEEVWAELGMER